MEYQKIINLLDDATNQLSKFRKRNQVEINDESLGASNDNNNNINNNNYYYYNNVKFKTTMIKSNLCDYSDLYILVKGTITVPNTATIGVDVNNANKKVIFCSI